MPDRDIVDAIDELVDWQMSQYENRSGYDRNVNQVDCPHSWCREPWHGLAITRRMQEMRWGGQVDPAYRYADDDSEVLCPGSEFDGEFTPPESVPSAPYIPGPIEALLAAQALWGDVMAAAVGIPGRAWQLPDDPYDETSSRGVIDMAEVDRIRSLRCQVDTPDAAYAEYLREHVRCSFFEEVASRYPGVQLDPAEIRTEYRQDGIRRLAAWWEPDPLGGILEGGHANGREVGPNVGDRVETVPPVRFSPLDFQNPSPTVELNIVTYERAAYDTITRRWVYRPRQARRAPVARSRHLIVAATRADARRYAAENGLAQPIIVTQTIGCRGLDPTQFVIHDLGCDPRVRAELRHRASLAGVALESLIHTPGDHAA